MKEMYVKNYKTLIKGIKEDVKKWKDILCSMFGKIILKMATQSNLQIQCNPYLITKDIFHRTGTKYLKVCLEAQKTQKSQRHPEKEKGSWRNQAPSLQILLQNYSHQNCVVLAQKQI